MGVTTIMWSTPVHLYCERMAVGFWAEPVNAATNVAFLVTAFCAFARWRRAGGTDDGALALICVTVLVGCGSFGFHTLATRGAMLLDVIPIAAFIYGYLLLALRRYVNLSRLWSSVRVAAFAGVSTIVPDLLPLDFLNGSGGYLPALAALIAVAAFILARPDVARTRNGAAHRMVDSSRSGTAARALLAAAGVFFVSLVFRSIDLAICPAFAPGTHFVWHILNAVVLYILLRAAIDYGPVRRQVAAR
jgi:Ceramidase